MRTHCIIVQSVFHIWFHSSISSPISHPNTAHGSCRGCHPNVPGALGIDPDWQGCISDHELWWHPSIRTICYKVNLPRPLSITSTNTLIIVRVYRHLRDMNLCTTRHYYVSISHDVDRVVLLCYWSPTIVVGLLPSRSMSGPTIDQDGPFWWGS